MRSLVAVSLLAMGLVVGLTAPARVNANDSARGTSVYDFTMKSLDGKEIKLSEYKGKVLLIVNVASRCGYTPQYKDLQSLYAKYQGQGLVVLGVPCNQFGGQEPGSEAEIGEFCQKNYGVTFPMLAKVDVNGDNACDLYKYLTTNSKPSGKIGWNFEKFLVGRDGRIIGRYKSGIKPMGTELIAAIESELAKQQ